MVYGPSTDSYGRSVTWTSDGAGGGILSCPKYASNPLAVSAAQLADPLTAELVARLTRAEDVYTNYRNLSQRLGLGDPGESQIGSPE